MIISLEKQVAVVTGGSRGIGAATVKLFAAAGARVVFSYHQAAQAARGVVEACNRLPGSASALRADARRVADARRLIETARRRYGRLDILVANAGVWNDRPAPIETMREKEWDEMMAVNLKGVYAVIHFAAPCMIRQKSGRIIVVSSTAGQRGEAFHTHYGAAKGGVISLVKGLATELAPHHILVNAVAPGWIATDMCAPVLRHPRQARAIAAEIPLRRLGQAEEVALPILFLASSMSTYMTGEIININGGNVLCG